jgi:ubiquinone/menaquinone biosynthesis C-methylase UbiE
MSEKTPWDWMDPGLTKMLGEQIFDPKEQERWCSAVFFGNLPYMWVGKAVDVKTLALRPGDKVLLLGEAIESCFYADIRERVGPQGEIKVIDITGEARAAYLKAVRGRGGQLATWKWTYTESIPDEYFDCVAILQGVTHTDDWHESGRELTRIMKSGRNFLLAEICIGPDFFTKAKLDIHIESWIDKIFSRVGFRLEDFPYYSAKDLKAALDGVLTQVDTFEWKGIELLWGTKR